LLSLFKPFRKIFLALITEIHNPSYCTTPTLLLIRHGEELKEKTMKKYFYISFLTIALSSFTAQLLKAQNRTGLVKDSVTMGPSYVNEIYYSFTNGSVAEVQRDHWDIAFGTHPFTINSYATTSILTNEGVGVMLYTYPKSDTTGWATLDTVGINTWTPMYNSPDNWDNGAFCRNAKSDIDVGWGVYNVQNHNVVGDSLFVIKFPDGSCRKLWIVRKYSIINKYSFRYAKLDGSADTSILLDCNPYTSKNFVGISLQNSEIIDFEPNTNTWDILFTKYESIQQNGTPYPVTGVLTNIGLKTIKYRHTDPDFLGWDLALADSSRSAIGWDWKARINNAYVVEDSLVFFVQDYSGNMNKLMFTKFEGGTTGKIGFKKAMISAAGISENTVGNEINIYPNPVREKLNIILDNAATFPVLITLSTISGQVVYSTALTENSGHALCVPISDMPNGMYLLTARSARGTTVKKVVVNK
jgi:hypothetical protein